MDGGECSSGTDSQNSENRYYRIICSLDRTCKSQAHGKQDGEKINQYHFWSRPDCECPDSLFMKLLSRVLNRLDDEETQQQTDLLTRTWLRRIKSELGDLL